MKTRLLALAMLLCTTFATKAQYVTIPDAGFRNFIINAGMGTCLNGNQLDTTCMLIRSRTTIDCSGYAIANLDGIQYFDSLLSLDCSDNNLSAINSLPPRIINLYCNNNSISSISSLPSALRVFSCNLNQLTTLPPIPASMRELSYNDNNISIYVSVPDSLERLSISNNPISVIPSLPVHLYNLWALYMSNLTSLPELPASLFWLNCSNSPIVELPTLPDSLRSLYCTGCSLSIIPELPPLLRSFECSNNPSIKCLPRLPESLDFLEFENTAVGCIPNYTVILSSIPPLNTLPLCTPGNTNDCVVSANLSGNAFVDLDSDCIHGGLDKVLENFNIKLLNNSNLIQQTTSNSGGYYSFDIDVPNTYETRIETIDLPFFAQCPISGILYDTLTLTDSAHFNRNFALRCKAGFDLAAHSISTGQIFRPANNTEVNIQAGDLANFYHASCTQGVAGAVTVTINGPATYLAPASGATAPSNVSGNVITWNVADFGTANALTDFNIIVRTDTFAQIGAQACFTVRVTPTVGDNDSSNNTLTYCFPIVNSYDPNDKTAYPGGDIDTAQEWLTYTVRFQNTGNAEA